MADDKVILDKLSEVGDAIKHVQDKCKALETKQDAVDFASLKDTADKAAAGYEAVQVELQKIKAAELTERLFGIEKAVALFKQNPDAAGTSPEHKQAFYSYLRKGTAIPQDVINAYCADVAKKSIVFAAPDKVEAYAKALVEGSNPDGGFFITPERSAKVMTRVFESSPLRLVANTVTTAGSSIEMVIDDDEAGSGWVGEVETRATTDTPQIGLLTIPVHELYAKPKASQNMLDDAGFDVEGWLQGKVSAKFARDENTAFITGNGSKKPKGILSYTAWTVAGTYQRDAIEQVTSTGTSAYLDESDDFISLQNALIEDYQANAAWLMARGTFSAVMKLKDGEGQYLLNPYMVKEGTDRVFLGKRVILMSDMPAVAASSLSVAYGDFREGYTIVDRFGIRVLRDPYSAKPYVEFYSTKRVGGAVTNYESFKIMKTKA